MSDDLMTSFHCFLHAALFSSQSHVLHAPMSEPVFVSRDPVSANQEPVFVSPEPEPGSLSHCVGVCSLDTGLSCLLTLTQ